MYSKIQPSSAQCLIQALLAHSQFTKPESKVHTHILVGSMDALVKPFERGCYLAIKMQDSAQDKKPYYYYTLQLHTYILHHCRHYTRFSKPAAEHQFDSRFTITLVCHECLGGREGEREKTKQIHFSMNFNQGKSSKRAKKSRYVYIYERHFVLRK